MPDTRIDSTTLGNFQGTITDYAITPVLQDNAQDQDETYYENTNWQKYMGYYKAIPELGAAIDAKATWTIGKGFKSNEITEIKLACIVTGAKTLLIPFLKML